ncbi:plasmid partitioning protein RepB [Pseudogemmobacter sonorensis]|uniref:plasmid partitioning protein RepB n=1 Tax=Pseudogemmobacter sonorensis TaxID=2989681 RepID=UPI0036B3AC65
MARKDLLKGLLNPTEVPASPSPAAPRMTKGAIGAVGQSIADLKSRSVIEVDPALIDEGGLEDRLDEDAAGIAELAASIHAYGQQVPVLLRHAPAAEGRFQVVYGRRRVAALRLLGQPVRAMLRDLSDRDLMIAQGQENAQRKDLSFIEKANFARQMRDLGFERAVICDALAVDKTVVSRMLTVADAIPLPVLHAIGAAPSVGRNRWLELAERIRERDPEAVAAAVTGADSDQRFEMIFRRLAPARPRLPAPPCLTGAGEIALGRVERRADETILALSHSAAPGFDDWLLARIERLHREFLARGEE